jgi:hypothetical protein
MASSIGFRDSVSFLLTIQATGFLTVALVGLPPTEYASLRWTHLHAGLSRRYPPQCGFSSANLRIRARISSVTFGRPPRRRERQRPYNRKPARCQWMTVSGFTMTSTSLQRDQKWRIVVQNSRSKEFNAGRGRLRLSTATCCRSARISRAVSLRLWQKTRITAAMDRMNSVPNFLL